MSQQHILKVSELTKKVRFLLESEIHTVWLTGEISNFVGASSGHWYLSLKDSKSQVRCAMFKGNNQRVRVKAKNGQQVLVKARVSLYEPRGDFQLIIEQMEDAGEGLLRQQFEQLKSTLNAQGLFSIEHKRDIPAHIKSVGIITSPTGAAVKDIITVLHRRNPNIEIIIYPALVQGEYAKNDICHAIALANNRQECDVLIVGRGGGSLEDLWPFNEEDVVRSIFHCTIPVISAVGHEIDTTLSDYVADLRAATPSAAAELVSNDTQELSHKINDLRLRLVNANRYNLINYNQHYKHIKHRLQQVHPEQKLLVQQQKADELEYRLRQSVERIMQTTSQRPKQLAQRLAYLSPEKNILRQQAHIEQSKQRLANAINNSLQHKSEEFISTIEQLQLVSPLATIARGYAIARDKNRQVIKSVSRVKSGDKVSVQISDGKFEATVD